MATHLVVDYSILGGDWLFEKSNAGQDITNSYIWLLITYRCWINHLVWWCTEMLWGVCTLPLYLGVCKQNNYHRYDTLHLDKTYDASGHLDLHSINCYDSASRLHLSPLLRFFILWPRVNKLLTVESNTPLMLKVRYNILKKNVLFLKFSTYEHINRNCVLISIFISIQNF